MRNVSSRKFTKDDLEILRILQSDALMKQEDIAEKIHKSASVVSRRIAELTKSGVITGAHAALDQQKVGLPTTVWTLVSLKEHGGGKTTDFEREIEAMPNVVEWSKIGGSWDYLLKFSTRDTEHYDLIHNQLLNMAMVSRVRGMHGIGKPHVKGLPI